ncbi:ATP-binding protein [Paracidovorax wautersii]|uniref:ATP-binding protein n=1 Tax=Paracidovorax wautersii TaxID=1177982 RepID=UPI0031DDD47C
MPTSLAQLQQWLLEPEGQHLEFKEAKQRYDFEKLLKYCVALANEGGGTMVLGVTDKRPRRIVGTQSFEDPGRTEAGLHQRLGHRIPVEELRLPEGRVLLVHVPPRLPGTAWNVDGSYLKRAGDDLVPLADQELRVMFAEGGPDFSAQPCQGATLADLHPESIALFRERWAKKSGDLRKHDLNDQQTLRDAELLVEGDQVSYAALILFGTRAGLTRWLAQAELVFEYRSSEAAGPAADREEYRAGFFSWQDTLWKKINLRNDRQSYQDDFFRMDLPTFDEVPVREALLNAVAHRDYRLGGSIFVRQFAKRLEVVSPGGLPAGITPENIIDQQNPRNRRLAEALARCGLIERSGQGLNLMMESAVRQGKPLPSFAGTAAHEVRLTLEGGVRNPAFVRFMERLGEERLRSFSTLDYLALERLEQDRALTPELQERLPTLAEVGAVEVMGRGKNARYMLAAALYATLGSKGTYTRRRGLDRGTNKALLLQHLKDQGEAGAPLSEFRQVLPSLTMKAVQKLLDELRNDGLIGVVGQRRWARWYLADAAVFKPAFNPKR